MTEIGRTLKHKATHQDGGADEIVATGLVGRCNFVDRGDPTDYDFQGTDLTSDDAWNDLDLSSIVPAGAIAVLLRVWLKTANAGSVIYVRKNGNANVFNMSAYFTQVANVYFPLDIITFLDANRKIEYQLSNVTWTLKAITVGGWWI